MNLRDWFYRQKVTEAELDSSFGWCQDADRALALDGDAIGVLQGLGLSETGPASMSLAYAAGVAYAKAGERCAAAVAGAIDCSQDEYGVPTAVANLGNTKWIAVFMRPTRVLSEPRTDGNSNEVYTIKTEVGELFVRQGSEGISPARVGLSASAILLGEVELAHLQTAITTGDVDETRREDWVRTTTVTFGDKVHGTPQDAIVDMWAEMDLLGSGGGPFTFASQWFGATDVSGAAPPVTTFGEAIDAMVYDLSLATGSALIGTADYAGTYIAWSSAAVSGALSAIATAADQHIGGAAPQHPATAVTFDDTNFSAAWSLNPSEVQEAIDFVVGALIDETGGASGASRVHNEAIATSVHSETAVAGTLKAHVDSLGGWIASRAHKTKGEKITGKWDHVGTSSDDLDYELDAYVKHRFDAGRSGGTGGPGITIDRIVAGLRHRGSASYPYNWGNPRAACNRFSLGAINLDKLIMLNVKRDIAGIPETGMISRVVVGCGRANGNIYVGDLTSPNAVAVTIIDVTAHLPSGSGQDWRILSICGVSGGIFGVLAKNEAAAPNQTYQAHAFTMTHTSGGGYAIAPIAAMPATGYALPGTGPEIYSSARCSDIIAYSSSYLYTLNGWRTTSNGDMVSRVPIGSGSVTSGIGDATSSVARSPLGGFTTDGNYLYFTTYDSGLSTTELGSAGVSSLGSGSGLPDFPLVLSASCVSVCHDGSQLFMPLADGDVDTYCLDATAQSQLTKGTISIGILGHCCFDGRNVWFSEYVGGNVNLIGVDCARVRSSTVGTPTTMDFAGARKYFITKSTEACSAPEAMGRLLFDGGSVLVGLDTDTGQSLTGRFARLSCSADRT